jgi:peroxiredoxin Q/BCP
MAIPQPGKLAPDFTLPTDGGDKVELSQFKGRKVVLYFYPKDDTSGCTLEAVTFTALAPEFAAAGAAVVGVSPDSVKSHDRFKAKHELGVILAADEERKAIEAYGVWGEKSMYGRKYMGVLRTTFLIGPDGRIVQVWENVKVKGHAEAVLAAVKAL